MNNMKLADKVTLNELKDIASRQFGDLVKAVVDIEKQVMVIGGELHADEEAMLINQGSKQMNLWGINLYPEYFGSDDFVEFDSMINIRPSGGNTSRGVEDESIRVKILTIVGEVVGE